MNVFLLMVTKDCLIPPLQGMLVFSNQIIVFEKQF